MARPHDDTPEAGPRGVGRVTRSQAREKASDHGIRCNDVHSVATSIQSKLRWNFLRAGSTYEEALGEALAPYDDHSQGTILKRLRKLAGQGNPDADLVRALDKIGSNYNRKDRCHERLQAFWQTSDYIPASYRPDVISRDLLQELWGLSQGARAQHKGFEDLWGPEGIVSALLQRKDGVQKVSVATIKKARHQLHQSQVEGATAWAREDEPDHNADTPGGSASIALDDPTREDVSQTSEEHLIPSQGGVRSAMAWDHHGIGMFQHHPRSADDDSSASVELGRHAVTELPDAESTTFPTRPSSPSPESHSGAPSLNLSDTELLDNYDGLVDGPMTPDRPSLRRCSSTTPQLSPQDSLNGPDDDVRRSCERSETEMIWRAAPLQTTTPGKGFPRTSIPPEDSQERPTQSRKRKRSTTGDGGGSCNGQPGSQPVLDSLPQHTPIGIDDGATERTVPFASLRHGVRSMRSGRMLNDNAINTMVKRLRSDELNTVDSLGFKSFEDYHRENGVIPHWARQNTGSPCPRKLLIPLHDEKHQHWSLAIGHMEGPRIDIYDSAGLSKSSDEFPTVRRYLSTFRPGMSFTTAPIKVLEGPRQGNGVDCGIYVIRAARAMAHLDALDGPWDPGNLRIELAAQMSTSDHAAPPGFSSHTCAALSLRTEPVSIPADCQPFGAFLKAKSGHGSALGYYACALAAFHQWRDLAFVELDRLEREFVAFKIKVQRQRQTQRQKQVAAASPSTADGNFLPSMSKYRASLLQEKAWLAARTERVDRAIAEAAHQDVERDRMLGKVYPQLLFLKASLVICHILGPRFSAAEKALREMQVLEDGFAKAIKPYTT